ncbi:MAG: c-type cytochrome domain-containing protein [Verrucomicrobiota bacterium]
MEDSSQTKKEEDAKDIAQARKETNPSLGFAIVLALALLVGMGYLWQTFGSGVSVPQWMKALGQFHPIVVQVPIALIGVVFLMELLGLCKGLRHLKQSTRFLLWIAGLSAAVALVLGFMLKVSSDGGGIIMQRYIWAVAAMTAGSLACLMMRSTGGGLLYGLVLTLTLCAVLVAAQLSGSLAYGSTYLTKNMPDDWQVKKWLEVENRALGLTGEESDGEGAVAKQGEEKVEAKEEEKEPPKQEAEKAGGRVPADGGNAKSEAKKEGEAPKSEKGAGGAGGETVYAVAIAPILEAKCVACHGEEKTKGKLRLDDYELALESEGVIVPGDLSASELIARIELPADDDDVMPPEDEPALTDDEKAILTWWIENDGTSELKMADAELPEEIVAAIGRLPKPGEAPVDAPVAADQEPAKDEGLSDEETAQVVALNEKGFAVRAISQEDAALEFNAVNVADEFGDEALAMFVPLGAKVAELNLARTSITDAGAKSLGKLSGLKKLHLEGTEITDAALADLAGLGQLEWLNVYGTGVTDAGLKELEKAKSLKKLYVWQTKVTDKGVEAIEAAIPGIYVERGWDESDLPLKAAAVPEDAPVKKDDAKPAEPEKKPAAPKKDAPADAKPAPKAGQGPAKPAAGGGAAAKKKGGVAPKEAAEPSAEKKASGAAGNQAPAKKAPAKKAADEAKKQPKKASPAPEEKKKAA